MKILITAGPTREAIDPVRYISNRSSGKMGYALAEAALASGHQVSFISGPVALSAPSEAQTTQVLTAAEMYAAVENQLTSDIDAAIFCAAVADYRPISAAEQKIKKTQDQHITLTLEKTADILGSARSPMGFEGLLIGFAAETQHLEKNAQAKLKQKKCDLMIANLVGDSTTGFDVDENQLQLFYRNGKTDALPRQTKVRLAQKLIEIIEKLGEAKT
ncbi:MAG: phosphopantothenoylcysteine decarboxylase [Verrucomicrobiales bacterium]|nr:phosphopantothenoylcysteine decarboxylase [Verrucomicrobiales bacterium]